MPDVPISTTATPAPLPAQASASPLEYWKKGFLHYAEFRGCASRPEFWWFMALPLLALVPALAGYIITDWLHIPDRRVSVYGDALTILLWAALVLPCLAVTFRRLHDTGRSGFWALVLLLPFGLGRLFFFYLTLSESKTENNKYRGNTPVQASAPPDRTGRPAVHALLPLLAHQPAEADDDGGAGLQSGILVLLSSLPLPVPAAGVQHGGLRQHSPASVFFPFP